jgi:hypothetical protein
MSASGDRRSAALQMIRSRQQNLAQLKKSRMSDVWNYALSVFFEAVP